MGNTFKPVLAGWLDIVAGIVWLTGEGFLALAAIGFSVGFGSPQGIDKLRFWIVLAGLAVPGLISIYAGICSIVRRVWWLALVGSITAIPLGLGVVSVVLVILSKNEFRRRV